AALEELCDREPGPCARLVDRLGFRAVAIGLVKQPVALRPELIGEYAVGELLDPGCDLRLLMLSLFHAGQGGAQSVRRRGAISTPAFAVEIHRDRMQLHEDARGLDGGRGAPAILLREFRKAELLGSAALPEEVSIHAPGHRLRLREQVCGTRL